SRDGLVVEIRREDLHLRMPADPMQALVQRDGERVGLLSRRASRDPRSEDLTFGALAERALHAARERFPYLTVTKEPRAPDEEVSDQCLGLQRARLEQAQVANGVVDVREVHAALEPAHEKRRLVAREVRTRAAEQEGADVGYDCVERLSGANGEG